MLNPTVSTANIDRYADLVMDKFHRRRVIEVGHKIVDFGYDSTLELEKLLNDSEQELFSVTQQRIRLGTDHNSEIAMSAFNQLEENNPIYLNWLTKVEPLERERVLVIFWVVFVEPRVIDSLLLVVWERLQV